MPIDPSIPLQQVQVNPMQSMGQAASALSQLAQLQNTRTQGVILQNEAQNSTQMQNERVKFAQSMKDPNAPFKNQDGTIDYGKLQQWTATNAPLIGSQYGDQIMNMAGSVNRYQTDRANMATSDRTSANSILASAMGPDGRPLVSPQALGQQLDQLKPQLTGAGSSYIDQAKQILNAAKTPEQYQAALGQLSRDTTPPATQNAQLQGSLGMLNTGAAQVPFIQNPSYGVAPGTLTGAATANQVGPDNREQLVNDPFGNPTIQTRDLNGNIVSGPGIANPLGNKPLAPGDLAAIPELIQQRSAINAAASTAASQRYNNQQIVQLASNATTGPGSDTWNKFMGGLGLANHAAGDAASQFQLLGHYTALQAQNNASAMGVRTDAAQALANAATGTPEMNRQALIEATKTNDALAHGLQDFNTGMEKAISNSSGDVRAKRDFQNAWSQNFDPVAYKIRNALDSGDAAAATKIWNSLNPTQQQQLKTKQQNLLNLVTNGHL